MSQLKSPFNVIGISEHKITNSSGPVDNLNLDGYNKFIFAPTDSTHGGTGFYVKENTDIIERFDLDINSTSNHETKFIEIKFENKRPLIIGCVYRHPSSSISVSDFSNLYLDPLLTKISNENKQCIVMGDFNINLLNVDNNQAYNQFYNLFTSNSFSPYILQPTRLQSKSLIDNIFFNSLEFPATSGNLLVELSDHLIQFLTLEGFVKVKKKSSRPFYKRDFRKFNKNEFYEEVIAKTDWDLLCKLEDNDPNLSCKRFYDTITHYLDEYAP